MDEDSKKLDQFLGRVDEISNIIQNLNADDPETRDKAMQEADKKLTSLVKSKPRAPDRTKVNRTVINKNAYKDSPATTGLTENHHTAPDSFMKAMEQDADERAERRRKNRAEATILKEEGNKHFKNADYEKAVDCYTQGLDKIKDYKELWTNRAQANTKLKRYEAALSDCDWALRVDDKFAKAYVLQAKIHLAKQNYDHAMEMYRKGIECDPKQKTRIEGYIRDVELSKEAASQEAHARKLFESGAKHSCTLVEVMKKVNAVGELPLYYHGGVGVLADMIIDDNCKTLFRTEGGLTLFSEHPYFMRIFSANISSLNREDLNSCAGMFFLLRRATEDMEESQRQLITNPEFSNVIMKFLSPSLSRKKKFLIEHCVDLLLSLSQTDTGRKNIVAVFDAISLLTVLFDLVLEGGKLASNVFSIVNNLAFDSRLKKILCRSMDPVLNSFEKLLVSKKHSSVIPCCISTVTNLCGDDKIRQKMANKESLLAACLAYLQRHGESNRTEQNSQQAIFSMLGLLINITLVKSESVKLYAVKLCRAAYTFLLQTESEDIQERAVGLLSHVLALSIEAIDDFLAEESRSLQLVSLLANGKCECYAVKALTTCTQQSKNVCQQIANNSSALGKLVALLDCERETTLGNVALCLGHCAHEKNVLDTLDIEAMKKLLVAVREAKNSVVKQNCAILIGKMAKGHSKHLEALRELDGIGILHNSTKYYKL